MAVRAQALRGGSILQIFIYRKDDRAKTAAAAKIEELRRCQEEKMPWKGGRLSPRPGTGLLVKKTLLLLKALRGVFPTTCCK
jgi:hypothetical protein